MKDLLKQKWVIFDTNIVTKVLHNPEHFQGFYDKLKNEFEIIPSTNYLLRFELLRIAKGKKENERISKFFKNNYSEIPIDQNTLNIAEHFCSLYNHCKTQKNQNQISLVDIITAAQIVQYKGRVMLVTKDLNDFPVDIFDRVKVFNIDTEKEVHTIGLYSFNEEKLETKKIHY